MQHICCQIGKSELGRIFCRPLRCVSCLLARRAHVRIGSASGGPIGRLCRRLPPLRHTMRPMRPIVAADRSVAEQLCRLTRTSERSNICLMAPCTSASRSAHSSFEVFRIGAQQPAARFGKHHCRDPLHFLGARRMPPRPSRQLRPKCRGRKTAKGRSLALAIVYRPRFESAPYASGVQGSRLRCERENEDGQQLAALRNNPHPCDASGWADLCFSIISSTGRHSHSHTHTQ